MAAPEAENAVVLIAGRKGAGKSTTSDMLVAEYGFADFSLAAPLRDMGAATVNALGATVGAKAALTVDMCHDPATKERPIHELVGADAPLLLHGKPATPRALMQWLGTDVCREFLGEDVWVHALVAAIKASGARRVVVSDVRFVNEARLLPTLLAAAGFAAANIVTLRIDNPDDEPVRADTHASEAEVHKLPYHLAVVNNKAWGVEALLGNVRSGLAPILDRLPRKVVSAPAKPKAAPAPALVSGSGSGSGRDDVRCLVEAASAGTSRFTGADGHTFVLLKVACHLGGDGSTTTVLDVDGASTRLPLAAVAWIVGAYNSGGATQTTFHADDTRTWKLEWAADKGDKEATNARFVAVTARRM